MKKVNVVPWFGGKWKVISNKFELIAWRVSWFVYYPLMKNKYEWKEY